MPEKDTFKALSPKPAAPAADSDADLKQQFETAVLAWAEERRAARFERERLKRNLDHLAKEFDKAEERLRAALDAPMPAVPPT